MDRKHNIIMLEGNPASAAGRRSFFGMRWIAVMWAALIVSLVAGSVWFFRAQTGGAEQAALALNISIAELKADTIALWRNEQIEAARALADSPMLCKTIDRWMAEPNRVDADAIIDRLKTAQPRGNDADIVLVDTGGHILLGLSGGRKQLSVEAHQALTLALGEYRPVVTDIYLDPLSGKPRIDVIAPVYRYTAGAVQPIGAIVTAADPEDYLYPLIQRWPIPSRSAETLLVRRDGDHALWLNNVRFNSEAACRLRHPLSKTEIPAVQAVLGREGVFRGTDYRGKNVVSFLARVPGSPWFIVSKIDADEIFSALRFRLFVYYALLTALLAGAFVSTLALRQRAAYFSSLHEKDAVIRRYAARLEEVNKELEAFNYSVSHDLRAPLRGMDGFSKALLEEYAGKLDETGKGYLARVRAAAQSMGQLIDDLLNLSRITRADMKIQPVDVSGMARRIAAELQAASAGRAVDFVVEAGVSARADPHLLEIALRNLLGNAWKYTGPHASARIEIGMVRLEGRDTYFVRDDGVGFDRRYYDKLFNPFQRLHSEKEFPGTGIGLATIRRIVERHGGRVWAESEIGKGATFYFTLGDTKEAQ